MLYQNFIHQAFLFRIYIYKLCFTFCDTFIEYLYFQRVFIRAFDPINYAAESIKRTKYYILLKLLERIHSSPLPSFFPFALARNQLRFFMLWELEAAPYYK